MDKEELKKAVEEYEKVRPMMDSARTNLHATLSLYNLEPSTKLTITLELACELAEAAGIPPSIFLLGLVTMLGISPEGDTTEEPRTLQ